MISPMLYFQPFRNSDKQKEWKGMPCSFAQLLRIKQLDSFRIKVIVDYNKAAKSRWEMITQAKFT